MHYLARSTDREKTVTAFSEPISVLDQLAFSQGRRDQVPNQQLAKELAESRNQQDIQEIAQNLWNENRNIRGDCIKVLYEIGYLAPELIADYVDDFLKLLTDKNNRIVWGGMIALSTIAVIKADDIYPHVEEIKRVTSQGSVITRDAGIKALAGVASAKAEYRRAIFPFLLNHLETCRAKEVPQHAESILVAVDASTRERFVQILQRRMPEMKSSGAARVRKVVRKIERL
jgi:hypothetical protein